MATAGSYSQKQFGTSWMLRFSHGARFQKSADYLTQLKPRSVLDYGCGDGTFLGSVVSPEIPKLGVDYDSKQIAECQNRFRDRSDLSFRDIREMAGAYQPRFNLVTCTEVLEHCVEKELEAVLERLENFVEPEGHILISVPVETGPTVLAKHFGRWLLAKRHYGDYEHREKMSPGELLTLLFANAETKFERPVYHAEGPNGERTAYHGHKGFNWRALEKKLAGRFDLIETSFSPVGLIGFFVPSQVWFLCTPKKSR